MPRFRKPDAGIRGDFWSKVDSSAGHDGCWPWMGARMKARDLRGIVNIAGKLTYAHRQAWTLSNGPIPAGMCICHHCDNTVCCNPAHLFCGTQAENVADRDSKGRCRARGYPGERNGAAKLSHDNVDEIRRLRSQGVTCRAVAKQFDVSGSLVSKISRFTLWKEGL